MAQSGISSAGVGFVEESAWGTALLTSPGWLDARGGMESVNQTVEQIIAQDIGQFGTISEDVVKGYTSVAGSLDFDLRYGGKWLMFLGHLVGRTSANAGSSPYTHTVLLGSDPITAQVAKGITLIIGRDGQGGGTYDWIYAGCRPTSMTFNFPENGIATASVTLIGESEDSFVSEATPSYSTDAYIKAPSDATSPTSFLSYNGYDYVCKSGSVTINVPWELRRDLQATLGLVPVLSGQLDITASFEVEMPNTTGSGNVWDAAYAAQTRNAVVMTMEGATPANEKLAITLDNALITTPPTPHVSGPELQTMSIEVKAFGLADGTDEGSVVLTNTTATGW